MLPIVDFMHSPLCKLFGYLHRACASLVVSGPTFIPNSQDFSDKVRHLTVDDDEVMVSFDVVSLKVHRKNPHTGWYLHFTSVNPVCQKWSVAFSLIQRAQRICCKPED